jgi:hypothetical protein
MDMANNENNGTLPFITPELANFVCLRDSLTFIASRLAGSLTASITREEQGCDSQTHQH